MGWNSKLVLVKCLATRGTRQYTERTAQHIREFRSDSGVHPGIATPVSASIQERSPPSSGTTAALGIAWKHVAGQLSVSTASALSALMSVPLSVPLLPHRDTYSSGDALWPPAEFCPASSLPGRARRFPSIDSDLLFPGGSCLLETTRFLFPKSSPTAGVS